MGKGSNINLHFYALLGVCGDLWMLSACSRRDEYGDLFEDYGFLKRVSRPVCLHAYMTCMLEARQRKTKQSEMTPSRRRGSRRPGIWRFEISSGEAEAIEAYANGSRFLLVGESVSFGPRMTPWSSCFCLSPVGSTNAFPPIDPSPPP